MRRCLVTSLALHALAAWFSTGFYQFDEQFQILELAGAKLGLTPEHDLPWEFRSRIRPWFQPGAAYALARVAGSVGIDSPFAWAFMLRAVSGVLGLAALLALTLCLAGWVHEERWRKRTVLALTTLWFLPYLHVRASSESWAGSFFLLGFLPIVWAVQRERRALAPFAAIASGIALGLAFEARYQAGVLIAGALFWSHRYAKLGRRTWVFLLSGGTFAVALGTALDRWGYGEWTCSACNYVRINVLAGKANDFGVDPFWAYVPWVLWKSPLPLGVLFVLGTLAAWILKPRFSLTWCTLPFVLVHCALSHKELRFLFPIAATLPVLVAMAWQAAVERVAKRPWLVSALRAWLVLSFGTSFLFWGVLLLPSRAEIGLYALLYDEKAAELLSVDRHPYSLGGLESHFYRPRALRIVQKSSYRELLESLRKSEERWLFARSLRLPPEAEGVERHCSLEWQSLPRWASQGALLELLRVAKAPEWSLYRCGAKAESARTAAPAARRPHRATRTGEPGA